MKVTTINPVYINKTPIGPKSRFLSFDGSNKSDVKAFQSWYNSKGYTPKLVVDGVYGPMSKSAYNTYGADYEKAMLPTQNSTTNTAPAPTTNTNLSQTDSKGNKKDGHVFDKAKGIWVKAKDSGLFDSAKNWVNNKLGDGADTTQTPSPTTVDPTGATPPAENKGMSKGLKIGLIVGGSALVLYVLYRISQKNKK